MMGREIARGRWWEPFVYHDKYTVTEVKHEPGGFYLHWKGGEGGMDRNIYYYTYDFFNLKANTKVEMEI
jgi:hypothetical protein